MLSIEQMDDHNYVVRARFLYHLRIHVERHNVAMSLCYVDDVGDDFQPWICLGNEIWATQFWSVQPYRRLRAELLEHVRGVYTIDYPLELVYQYGGLLYSRVIPMQSQEILQ